MYYIEQQEDELVKYEVEIKGLYELLKEIVIKCGKRTHKSYNSTIGPNITDDVHIRNYNEKIIGKTESNDELTNPPQDLYHFEYDEYEDPKLVKIVRRIVDGDTAAIAELKNPSSEQENDLEKDILQKKINKILSQDLTKIDIQELDKLKNKLIKYQEAEKLNNNRKSDLEYYPEVLRCISLTEVDRIKIEELNQYNKQARKMENFFLQINSPQVNQEINNELYRRLVIK